MKGIDATSVNGDYGHVEHNIFSALEHAEKSVKDNVRDEVDVLFGKRGGSGSSGRLEKEMKNTRNGG